jgi:hypothetical protein
MPLSPAQKKTVRIKESLGISVYDSLEHGDFVYPKENQIVDEYKVDSKSLSLTKGFPYKVWRKRSQIDLYGNPIETVIIEIPISKIDDTQHIVKEILLNKFSLINDD